MIHLCNLTSTFYSHLCGTHEPEPLGAGLSQIYTIHLISPLDIMAAICYNISGLRHTSTADYICIYFREQLRRVYRHAALLREVLRSFFGIGLLFSVYPFLLWLLIVCGGEELLFLLYARMA